MKHINLVGRGVAAVLLVVVALLMALAPAASAAPARGAYDAAVQKAAAWVVLQQQPDGSFPGFGVGSTADAIFGLVAAGRSDAVGARAGKPGALDYLAAKAKDYAKTPGAAAKLLLALAAVGQQGKASDWGGVDLLKVINDSYDASNGHYGKDVTGQALVLLADKATGQTPPQAAVNWLLGAVAADGGWAFDGSTDAGKADTNTTGLALQALAAAGQNGSPVLHKGLNYLSAQQNSDGGFAYQKAPDAASDANSTAMVVMGIRAIGENPADASWKQNGVGPLDFLASLQNADGALRFQAAQPADNAGATYQAIPALAGLVLPIPPAAGGAPSGGPVPGMPTSGAGNGLLLPLAALLAAGVLMLGGRRLRRR
ncbi:MAG: prenyltransferase/squalene oxidase repeat-containing protein [Chloroflexia bacterium]